jgi:hypothetical protein
MILQQTVEKVWFWRFSVALESAVILLAVVYGLLPRFTSQEVNLWISSFAAVSSSVGSDGPIVPADWSNVFSLTIDNSSEQTISDLVMHISHSLLTCFQLHML